MAETIALKKPQLPHPDWAWPKRQWDRIDWKRLNLFEPGGGGAKPPKDPDQPQRPWHKRPITWWGASIGAVVLAVILFLAWFDWNMLRGPIGRYATERTGRTVQLTGDLRVKLLTFTPRVDVGGLKVGNPSWGPRENMAEIANIAVEAKLLPLLSGRMVLPLLEVDRPRLRLLRDVQGRANWELEPRQPAEPLKLPLIQNFIIKDGDIRMADVGRKLTFAGTINAAERANAAYARGFSLTGRGGLNNQPFLLNVVGGPLINVRRDRPYPFDAEIRAGATVIVAKGTVPKPFDLGLVRTALTVTGRDMNELYALTGLTLPNTPPYRVRGQLTREGMIYRYDDFTGTVGRSDISGDAKVDLKSGRPFLEATLHSRLLDFADLAGLFGAPGASAAATAAQKGEVQALAAQGRMLPDATLQVERMRSMDAKVSYTAADVRAPNLPLRGVKLGVALDKGVLKLDPISFEFPTGRLTGTAGIDARKDTPVSNVDLRVNNIRLEQFIPAVSGSRPVSGTLLGRARLTGAGNSVHRAASNANGAVTVVIPGGQIRKAFAELMGINATRGLFLLLSKDNSPTDIRCAVADFQVRDGTMVAQQIVFDTGPVVVNGSGTISLDTERMDLEFKGKPKKFRLVRVIAPLTVGGQLRAPKFGIEPETAVAQAGIAAVLGSLLTPLAAVLPFVDPGLAKNADCAGLMAEARQGPAPVNARPTTASAPSKGRG